MIKDKEIKSKKVPDSPSKIEKPIINEVESISDSDDEKELYSQKLIDYEDSLEVKNYKIAKENIIKNYQKVDELLKPSFKLIDIGVTAHNGFQNLKNKMRDSVTSGKNKEIINQIKTLLTDPDFAQNKKDAIKNADKTLLRSFSKELEKLEDMGKYETKNEKDLKVRKS